MSEPNPTLAGEARSLVIAVDGPAGSGKSTIARRVAQKLGYRYVDTGAMYRAMAWRVLREGVSLQDREGIINVVLKAELQVYAREDGMGVLVDGRDVTAEIRSERISAATSAIAVIPEVRRLLVEIYRKEGAGGGVVMEGRDIGTVAFPEAELKIFLTASVETRARRRIEQHMASELEENLEGIEESIRRRDQQDSQRQHAPLARAADAIQIDTTSLAIEQVSQQVTDLARKRIFQLSEA